MHGIVGALPGYANAYVVATHSGVTLGPPISSVIKPLAANPFKAFAKTSSSYLVMNFMRAPATKAALAVGRAARAT